MEVKTDIITRITESLIIFSMSQYFDIEYNIPKKKVIIQFDNKIK